MRRLHKNCEAQTSLDFLAGITIFLLAFIFVFAYIPDMFTPFQSNSDEMTMMADRVGMILVEDVLIKDGNGDNLGIIESSRFDSLKTDLKDSGEATNIDTRKSLGLDSGRKFFDASAIEHIYDLEVELQVFDGASLSSNLIAYDPGWMNVEPGRSNIGQSRRFVYVDDGTGTLKMANLLVRVW